MWAVRTRWQNKSKLCSFLSGLVWASGNSVIWTKMGQVLIREERFIRGCLVFTVLYKGTHAQIDALNISLVLFWFMRTIEKAGYLLNRLSVLERWKGDVLFWYILETNGQEWMQEQTLPEAQRTQDIESKTWIISKSWNKETHGSGKKMETKITASYAA